MECTKLAATDRQMAVAVEASAGQRHLGQSYSTMASHILDTEALHEQVGSVVDQKWVRPDRHSDY